MSTAQDMHIRRFDASVVPAYVVSVKIMIDREINTKYLAGGRYYTCVVF